ncbi:MAG TPA: hypothetical protein ENK87_02570 [Nitratifractor sp.]|jgi:hypothetical protein|nr:hypothetical protein [Nitratifractor sp.]HHH20790.1 hypothetical protein [Nitratifractor sp.]
MNINELLDRAERLFLEKKYSDALKIYAVALEKSSESNDAYVGAILCDLGFEFKEEAQVIYYYFQTIKDSVKDPKSTIEQLASALHTSSDDIFDLIDAEVALDDGIEYDDFLDIIQDKENFQEAFEDAIFSTKVIISKKSQFIDFIKRLTDNGYYGVALDYLESHAGYYQNDQDILTLYSLLPKGQL